MPHQDRASDTTPAAAAVEEGGACGARFLAGCAAEAQTYAGRLANDSQAALTSLRACGSPMDLLAVQQAWALARYEALAESAWRIWGAAFGSISAAAADPKVFRLPD